MVRLQNRPRGLPVAGRDLVVSTEAVPTKLEDGQVLVQNIFLAMDPAMRGWMNDTRSYLPPVNIGDIMRGASIGQVLVSRSVLFKKGDWVNCGLEIGWAEIGICSGASLTALDLNFEASPAIHLGILGT